MTLARTSIWRRSWRLLWVVLAVVLIAGCAASSNPRDPLERYNRTIFSFNDSVDRNVVKPVAETYRAYVPSVVRSGVRNFFANLNDVWTCANNLFQAKVGDALSDWMRVIMNTTFGIAGLYDVASEAGMEKHYEDFGQTLGWWGVPPGPYFVIPFLGPSTFRDTPALAIDMSVSLTGRVASLASDQYETALRWSMWGTNLVNQRADALETTSLIQQAALDPYAFARDAFLQRRRNQVYDGSPPREPDLDSQAPRDALHAALERGRSAERSADANERAELPAAIGVNSTERAVSTLGAGALLTQPSGYARPEEVGGAAVVLRGDSSR